MTRTISAITCIAAALTALAAPPVSAQPADLPVPPATTTSYPAGVKIARLPSGAVYANRNGQTLYGMDMRTVLRWAPDAAQFCQAEGQKDWEPLLAPAGSAVNIQFPRGGGPNAQPPAGFVQPRTAPDWTIIAGPQGPQWVYKGWHMVYVRKGSRAGFTEFDGAHSSTWNTLKFVPPVPQVSAPMGIRPLFVAGEYVLADKDGRVLFTGACRSDCQSWTPLSARMAGTVTAPWSIDRQADRPQWLYRGKPVFFSPEGDPQLIPAGAQALQP